MKAWMSVFLCKYGRILLVFSFFFSSRRRHTRWTGDWSSDVCSSDLGHASPFTTPDTKYIVSATRFSVPMNHADVAIDSYKQNFKGTVSFIRADQPGNMRSEEHTSELQSPVHLVCRLLLEKKKLHART